MYIRIDPQTKS